MELLLEPLGNRASPCILHLSNAERQKRSMAEIVEVDLLQGAHHRSHLEVSSLKVASFHIPPLRAPSSPCIPYRSGMGALWETAPLQTTHL